MRRRRWSMRRRRRRKWWMRRRDLRCWLMMLDEEMVDFMRRETEEEEVNEKDLARSENDNKYE